MFNDANLIAQATYPVRFKFILSARIPLIIFIFLTVDVMPSAWIPERTTQEWIQRAFRNGGFTCSLEHPQTKG